MTSDVDLTWDVLQTNPVRYFAKQGDKVVGGAARSRPSLARTIRNLPGYNIYVTLNPSLPQIRSIKTATSDITEWRWVLVDIDPTIPQLDASHMDQACALLSSLYPHYIRVSSGRGLQLWLSVTPIPVTPYNAARIERGTRNFLQITGRKLQGFPGKIDTSCSDLGRVARMPGTINHKTGSRAHYIDLGADLHTLQPFPAEVILANSGEDPRPTTREAPKIKSQILPMLTMTASTFLTEGVFEPGRHSAAYATACSLLELGVEEDLARDWIMTAAHLCHPPLRVVDAERAFQNARRKYA